MLSNDVQEIIRPAKQIVGYSIRASLNQILENQIDNKLRSKLASRAEDAKMIGGIVDRKQHLGTDSWGSNDTNVREIMEPAELAVEREYPNFERFPFAS